MQQHNGYWISGTAVPAPPYTNYWTPGGAVLFQRDKGSIVELARLTLHSFELDDEGVAELFGMELARLVADTSYHELLVMRRNVEQRTTKPPHRR